MRAPPQHIIYLKGAHTMSNLVVDVTVVNNSNQTARLRFPAESEMPAYLKTLARREELQSVDISDPYDDEGPAPAKPKKTRRAAAATPADTAGADGSGD